MEGGPKYTLYKVESYLKMFKKKSAHITSFNANKVAHETH